MKLIVVGGSGFVGRNFLSAFNRDGDTITATYHSDETFPRFAKQLGEGVTARRCDLLDEGNDVSDYDVALYLAGNSNHGWAGQNPADDLTLNAIAMNRFLDTFRGRLVLLSSAAVYLGHDGPVSPAMPTRPLFPYAISKLASELYAQWAYAAGRLAGCVVLRLYYAYGPGEEDRRLIRRALIEFGLRGSSHFMVNGEGTSLMGPLHVADLVHALGLVVRSSLASGVFDVLGERPYSVNEIVAAAARVCEATVTIEHQPTLEDHLGFYSDMRPFAQAFGFQPALSLDEGMKQYLAHLRRDAASAR